ncbi:MAG TPA: hypothetical protein VF875_04210 [Anaeromyxobacter sp.]
MSNERKPEAPLAATVGERLGGDPDVQEEERSREGRLVEGRPADRQPGRPAGRAATKAARPFPWGALALAAIGWAALTGIGSALRSRARRTARGARRLAAALPRP